MIEAVDLLCIGAGPKTISVFAKVASLKDNLRQNLRIMAVESNCVAGNWLPSGGMTNGYQRLGTRPEKDLVYPMLCNVEVVDSETLRRCEEYTWKSFLMAKDIYSNWIDMGMPRPTHLEWSKYLDWALNKAIGAASRNLLLVQATVERVTPVDDGWHVKMTSKIGQSREIHARSVLITGPGDQKPLSTDGAELMLRDGWRHLSEIAKVRSLLVVGAGESAGTFVQALLDKAGADLKIVIAAASGFRVRQEGFAENRFFSDASRHGWLRMSEDERRKFVSTSDTGVCSREVHDRVRSDSRVSITSGRVSAIKWEDHRHQHVAVSMFGSHEELIFDTAVNCTGFDQTRQVMRLCGNLPELVAALGGQASLSVDESFCVRGLSSCLIVPGLATLSQGPGYANLSCLGTVSDVVVHKVLRRRFTSVAQQPRQHAFAGA